MRKMLGAFALWTCFAEVANIAKKPMLGKMLARPKELT